MVRLKWPNNFLEDYVAPFIIGFSITMFVLWLQTSSKPKGFPPLATFRDKIGNTYLKREGLLNEAEIERISDYTNHFGIRAEAQNGFKREIVYSNPQQLNNTDIKKPELPVGEIWSWPRIEMETHETDTDLVWVVTPTYRNPYQYAELTRMAQALYPARNFVRWLVIDDISKSREYPNHITNLHGLLTQFGVNFTILKTTPRPATQRMVFKPKGVDARRTAIKYIRQMKLRGTLYFADDDNTYDSDIFRQMRNTKSVSIWPTGAITQWAVSSPVVNSEGVVVDFFDAWTANRQFPVDFASFAINCDLLHKNLKANIPWIQGYEETIFLRTLEVPKNEFQPLAANATEVLTWHTKTAKTILPKRTVELLDQQKNEWPESVRKLYEKYSFLFDTSSWTSQAPVEMRRQVEEILPLSTNASIAP